MPIVNESMKTLHLVPFNYLLTDKLRDGIRTNTMGMGKLIIKLTNFQIKPGFRLAKIL